MDSMWLSHFRSWEIVVQESEWLHCSHSAVHDGEWGESRGVSPEVHDPLHCFERVELQVVKPVQWAAAQHTRACVCVCVCVCVYVYVRE